MYKISHTDFVIESIVTENITTISQNHNINKDKGVEKEIDKEKEKQK